MKNHFTSRLPPPRAGNSKYAKNSAHKSQVRRHRAKVASEGCRSTSSQDDYVQTAQHVALSSLHERIQVLIEKDDDCMYHQFPGYQMDDSSTLSDASDMNERDLLVDASMYMLSGPQDWDSTFCGKHLKGREICMKTNTPSYDTDESDCYVPEEQFLDSSGNFFSSERYFNPCRDDHNPHQRKWEGRNQRHEAFNEHVERPPLPPKPMATRCAETHYEEMLVSSTVAETVQPAVSSSRSHHAIQKHENFEPQPFPDAPVQPQQVEKSRFSDIESSSNDANVPKRGHFALHEQGECDEQKVEDLVYGRARDLFAGILADYIQSAASARPMIIHPPSLLPNFPVADHEESKPPAIHRAATIVLKDILRINVATNARVSRLQRALKGRKSCCGRRKDQEHAAEERGNRHTRPTTPKHGHRTAGKSDKKARQVK